MPVAHFSRFRRWIEADKPMARIVRNMLWLGSSKGLGAVLSLAYLGIATRTLGVSDFGRFALVLSIGALIATFMQFDCGRAILRFGPHYLHAGDKTSLGRLIALCRLFDITTALIGCGIAWVIFSYAAPWFGWTADIATTGFFYCCVLLLATRSTPMGLLRLHNRFDLSAYAETMVPIVRMIGALILLFMQPGITGFLVVWAASEMVSAITFWVLAYMVDKEALHLRHNLGIKAISRKEPQLLYFLGVLNIGSTLTGSVKQVPVLALGSFVSPAAAGLFRLAYQLTQALSKVATLLARSAYAELNHAHASGGIDALRKLLAKANRFALVSAIILILIIALLGKPILWLIAGKAFISAYPLLLVLGIAAAIDFMAVNYEPALLAATDGKTALKLRFVGSTLLLILLALLLPAIGAAGAAWAMAGAAVANWLLFVLAVRKYVHGPVKSGIAETEDHPDFN